MFSLNGMHRRLIGAPEDGQALVEYALIIGCIAILAIGSLQLLGANVDAVLNQVAGGFGSVI